MPLVAAQSDGPGRVNASSQDRGTNSDRDSASISSYLSDADLTPEQLNIVQAHVQRGLPSPAVVELIERLRIDNLALPPPYQMYADVTIPATPPTPPITPILPPPAPTPAELLVQTLLFTHDATAIEGVSSGDHAAAAAQLPPRPGTLIGRDESLRIMISLLLDQDSSRIWVFGPAGIGKTSVALAAIHDDRVAEAFGADRGFFSCDAFTDLYDLIAGLELYLTQKSSSNPLTGVLQNLRSRARMLLVLDDFDVSGICRNEQGPAAWHTSFATELQSIPSLRIIFTSRDPATGPTTPAWMPRELVPMRLVEFSPRQLVKIFTNSFSSSNKSFPVAAFAVAAVIRDRSDGKPLAPTLLGRLLAMSPDIDIQMDQCYHPTDPVGAAMGMTITFVANTLEGNATFTLVLLAIIARLRDGLRPAMVEALRSTQSGLDVSLRHLTALGLVFVGSNGSIRVSRTIRECLPVALQRLTDVKHFLALHKYFWQLTVDFPTIGWELQLKAPRVIQPLPAETFNLIALLLNDDGEANADIGQMDVEKVDAIVAMVRLRRDATSSIKLLERLLSHTDDLPAWEACFHEELGLCYAVQGQLRLAITRMKIATDINKAISNTARAAWCDAFIGQLHALSGPDGRVAASACFNKALAVFSKLRDVLGSAHVMFQLGTLFLYKGMYEEATEPLETAFDLFNQQGDKNALEACHGALANLRALAGNSSEETSSATETRVGALRRSTSLTDDEHDDASTLHGDEPIARVQPRQHLSILTFDSGTTFDDGDPIHVAAKSAYYRDDDTRTINSINSHLM